MACAAGRGAPLLVPVLQCCASPCAAFPSCRSAHLVSRYRPRAPIIAVTRNDQTARQAHLYRGIFPVLCKQPAHDAWAEDVDLRVNLGMNVGECCAPASLWGLRQDLQQCRCCCWNVGDHGCVSAPHLTGKWDGGFVTAALK